LILLLIPGTWLDRSLWGAWVLMFCILEGIGIARKWGSTSLTDLTLSFVPKWMLAMFIGWMFYHFLVQYH
jgi:flagellar biosynthesis protein FliQ